MYLGTLCTLMSQRTYDDRTVEKKAIVGVRNKPSYARAGSRKNYREAAAASPLFHLCMRCCRGRSVHVAVAQQMAPYSRLNDAKEWKH